MHRNVDRFIGPARILKNGRRGIERIRKRMTEEFATATELREDRQSKI